MKKLITVIMAGMASASQRPLLPSTRALGQTGCRWVFSPIFPLFAIRYPLRIYSKYIYLRFLISKLLSIGRIWVRNICRWRHLSGFLANFCQRHKKIFPNFSYKCQVELHIICVNQGQWLRGMRHGYGVRTRWGLG